MSEQQYIDSLKVQLSDHGVILSDEILPYLESGPQAIKILKDLLKQANKGKKKKSKKYVIWV